EEMPSLPATHAHRTSTDAGSPRRESRRTSRLVGGLWRSRQTISHHPRRRRGLDRKVSDPNPRGPDFTNFFLSDVQMGLGSFLAFYLAGLGWSKQDVGLALTAGGIAAVLAQIPGGALADAVRWKRGLAALGVVLIGLSSLILALWPARVLVFGAEILHG